LNIEIGDAMPQIKNVSGTAFVVAEYRAEEKDEAAPLYEDPIVGLFLNDDSRDAARHLAARFPPVKDMVKIRTRYFDDILDQHLRMQFRQVVILGSGLDTRAVRKQVPGVKYFEIDDPDTLAVKRACYEERGLHVNVAFIPGNYVTDGIIGLLERNGFDFGSPAYFIWEGNVMYLPLDKVRILLAQIRIHVARFRLSCDYLAEAVISKTTGDAGITTLVDSFGAMGAPWLSGITDIQSFARELGVNVLEDFTTADLWRTYRSDRPIASPIFDFYSVCTLEGGRSPLIEPSVSSTR
jgi:methyltransferase (TIGR00027 family)